MAVRGAGNSGSGGVHGAVPALALPHSEPSPPLAFGCHASGIRCLSFETDTKPVGEPGALAQSGSSSNFALLNAMTTLSTIQLQCSAMECSSRAARQPRVAAQHHQRRPGRRLREVAPVAAAAAVATRAEPSTIKIVSLDRKASTRRNCCVRWHRSGLMVMPTLNRRSSWHTIKYACRPCTPPRCPAAGACAAGSARGHRGCAGSRQGRHVPRAAGAV